MVKFSADLIFLNLFCNNMDDNKVLIKLLTVGKLNDLLIIFELCKNILVGNVPISKKNISKLSEYEKELILLADKKKSFQKKVYLLKKNIHMFKILLEIADEFIIN